MHRIEGANNLLNMFQDGPPATALGPDWLNSVQEEIAYLIETVGVVLLTASTDTRTQLYSSILELLKQLSTIRFTPKTSAPAAPTTGDIVMADRVTWDPLSKGADGAYLTMYLGPVSGWGEVTVGGFDEGFSKGFSILD